MILRPITEEYFNACNDMAAAGHTAKKNVMGASKVNSACGRHDCTVCSPPLPEATTAATTTTSTTTTQ